MSTLERVFGPLVLSLLAVLATPGVAAALLYVVLNAINARLDGVPDTLLERLLDRLVIATRHGAINRVSLPILGRSLFAATLEAVSQDAQEPSQGDPPPDPGNRPSGGDGSPGYASVEALVTVCGVVLAFVAGMLVAGCRLPEPDGCQPFATRCSPAGVPEVCSGRQRWARSSADPCPSYAPCGVVGIADGGSPYHACAPVSLHYDGGAE